MALSRVYKNLRTEKLAREIRRVPSSGYTFQGHLAISMDD